MVLPILLQYQLLLKIYHWETKKYSRHIASDVLYEKVSDFIDNLVEYESRTKRLTLEPYNIKIHNMEDETALLFLENFCNVIESITTRDKGLRARRDDLIGYFHKAMYLFRLS